MGPGAAGRTGETGAGQARKSGQPAGGGRPAPGRGPAAEPGPLDLEALSKADLLTRAAELDVPGRSKMAKPELIKAIQAAGRPKRRARKIS
jgi:DNA end-binding protein Ku